jgi:hypothetical protein
MASVSFIGGGFPYAMREARRSGSQQGCYCIASNVQMEPARPRVEQECLWLQPTTYAAAFMKAKVAGVAVEV